jgi:hypothetical protein
MGKFSWDNRDPFDPWSIRLAFVAAVVVGAWLARRFSG